MEHIPAMIGQGEHIKDGMEREGKVTQCHPYQGTHKIKRCQHLAKGQSGREIRVDRQSPQGRSGKLGVIFTAIQRLTWQSPSSHIDASTLPISKHWPGDSTGSW